MQGIYLLVIRVDEDVNLQIGALGEKTFRKGLYAYVGSAQTNLEKRVARHLSKQKRLFWHIDYLLNCKAVEVTEVLFRQAKKAEECRVAEFFSKRKEPVRGFGCSDCRCVAHLFWLR
ncbi:MAG: GIY-YIG nuclease family protein [Candidatus Bathyarchaeia archaeon]|jgi:Uri superfamily endonuclease